MVPLTERDSFIREAQSDPELRPVCDFLFAEDIAVGIPGATTRSKLFDAVRAKHVGQFRQLVSDLELRRLSPDSDWIGDDCMVFFLLLGVKKFRFGDAFANRLLEARRRNVNPQGQRINQAFDAIQRGEFAMEGEFAFIKCVFRVISENWRPSASDSAKLYKHLVKLVIAELDPFLRLLALRAFDLTIEIRTTALGEGNWNEIIQRLQEEGPKLSLIQFFQLLKHVRLGVLVAVGFAFITVFGAGRVWFWWSAKPAVEKRVMPPGSLTLHTALADGTTGWLAPFVRHLKEATPRSTNLSSIVLAAETKSFSYPTKSFTITGTISLLSNVNVICFLIRPLNGLTSLTPINASSTGNIFSASVPACESGDHLKFLIHGLTETNASRELLAPTVNVKIGP